MSKRMMSYYQILSAFKEKVERPYIQGYKCKVPSCRKLILVKKKGVGWGMAASGALSMHLLHAHTDIPAIRIASEMGAFEKREVELPKFLEAA
jgi:hypothetical protein